METPNHEPENASFTESVEREAGMSSEIPQERLGKLAESLGFKETPELERLYREIAKAPSLDEVLPRYGEYSRLGEAVVEQAEAEAYGAAQIGLTIALARIWRNWGENNRFIDAVGDAAMQAGGMGFEEAARSLDEMLAVAEQDRTEVQRLAQASAGVVDQKDLDELASRPLEYALAAIYPLLYAAGQEADEFLRSHGFGVVIPDRSGQ